MKTKLFTITIFFSLLLGGCILDSLEKINQNIPISGAIIIENEPIAEINRTLTFNLNDSHLYQDYANDIKKLEYTSLSYRTLDLNIPNLEGTLQVSIIYGSNSTVYSKVIKPGDYIAKPLIINLPAAEITKINNYLAGGGRSFTANVTLNNLTPSSGTLTLHGYIDAVFNFEAEL